jgi:hypothetical protein
MGDMHTVGVQASECITLPPLELAGSQSELGAYVTAVRSVSPALRILENCSVQARRITAEEGKGVSLLPMEGRDCARGNGPAWIDVLVKEISPRAVSATAP